MPNYGDYYQDIQGKRRPKARKKMACLVLAIIVALAILLALIGILRPTEAVGADGVIQRKGDAHAGQFDGALVAVTREVAWPGQGHLEQPDGEVQEGSGVGGGNGGRLSRAVVTMYSPYETCKGVCVNASGNQPAVPQSMSCPRLYPLGTRFRLYMPQGWEDLSGVYVCDDRTAKKYDGRFDIFTEDYAEALAFGKQTIRFELIR